MKNINDLFAWEHEDLKERVKDTFNFSYISREVKGVLESGNDLYKVDDNFYHTVDIIVPDRAGTYMQKELLQKFNIEVDEEEYKENYYDYIYFVERQLFKATDEVLEERLKELGLPEGVNVYLDYWQGDISIFAIVENDYIPEEVKEQYIRGIDESIMVNLGEGYISEWESEEDDCSKYVWSFWDLEENKYVGAYIDNFTDQEILEILKDNWKDLIEEQSGYTWDKALDKMDLLNFLQIEPTMVLEWGEKVEAENQIELFVELDMM